MTEQYPINKVIVIGTLDAMRAGKKEVAVADTRTRTGGMLDRFALQVTSPYGEAFALPLTATGRVTGLSMLEQATIGQTVVVEGIARLYQDVDTRYTTQDDDRGRRYRELRLSVTAIREPREDEPGSGSCVWLEGVVAEPPRTIRHPSVPDLELAATLLTVEMREAPPFPGSRMALHAVYHVPVMIPLNVPQAGLLYKQGNRVRIEGEFDRTIVPQRGTAVNARLAELDAAFDAEVKDLRGQVKLDAEHRYRRNRRNLTEAPRASILVGFIEGVDAEEIDFATAQEHRKTFTNAQRAARRAREQGRSRSASNTTPQAQPAQELGLSDAPIHNVERELVPTDVLRPRRRVRDDVPVPTFNGSEE